MANSTPGAYSTTPGAHIVHAVAAVGTALVITTETDAALPISAARVSTLGAAQETDAALPLASARRRTLTPAAEVDQALPLSAARVRSLGVAAETEAALPLATAAGVTLDIATMAETALPLAAERVRSLGLATTSIEALALSTAHACTLTPAAGANQALPLSTSRRRALGIAETADQAVALTAAVNLDAILSGRNVAVAGHVFPPGFPRFGLALPLGPHTLGGRDGYAITFYETIPAGDTITTAIWTAPEGFTVLGERIRPREAVIWLDGGAVGKHSLSVQVTTAEGLHLVGRAVLACVDPAGVNLAGARFHAAGPAPRGSARASVAGLPVRLDLPRWPVPSALGPHGVGQVADYVLIFDHAIPADDEIATAVWFLPSGLIEIASSVDADRVSIRLSGGVAGEQILRVDVTTVAGRRLSGLAALPVVAAA